MEKLVYSVAEAAELLAVSEWTVYRLVERGHLEKMPHYGKSVRIAGLELRRFAAQGVMPTDAAQPDDEAAAS